VLVLAIEFVAMAVALLNFLALISAVSEAVGLQLARPRAQTHGAAELVDALQLAELEDDAMRGARIELGGIGIGQTADVARVFDHEGLHPETDAEIRDLLLTRVANGI